MTKTEAIEILDRYAHHSHLEVIEYPRKVAVEVFEMAIEALKAQLCEDAEYIIDYNELIEKLTAPCNDYGDLYTIRKKWNTYEIIKIMDKIKKLAQPCENCVSREAVHDMVRKLKRWCVRSEDGKFNNVGLLYDDVQFGIENLPPVQPERAKGKWIAQENEEMQNVGYYCSNCDMLMETEDKTRFYPNCGAEMEVKE